MSTYNEAPACSASALCSILPSTYPQPPHSPKIAVLWRPRPPSRRISPMRDAVVRQARVDVWKRGGEIGRAPCGGRNPTGPSMASDQHLPKTTPLPRARPTGADAHTGHRPPHLRRHVAAFGANCLDMSPHSRGTTRRSHATHTRRRILPCCLCCDPPRLEAGARQWRFRGSGDLPNIPYLYLIS